MKWSITIIVLSLVFIPVICLGETHVSGEIESDTWTLEGSPYILDDDITILTDNSLVIEAGVEVLGESHSTIFVEGGLFVHGTFEAPVLFSAVDSEEGWGAFIIEDNDSPTIMYHAIVEYGRVIEHPLHGGAFKVSHSPIELYHCEIRYNHSPYDGGGICLIYSDFVIVGTHFHHNECDRLGSAVDFAFGTGGVFHHNTINNNHAGAGASLLFYEGYQELDHCTLVNNTAGQPGHGTDIYSVTGMAVITNSIFWNDTHEEDHSSTNNIEANFCLVSDNSIPGDNQIDEDPMFVNIGDMDFNLTPESPCIDAGDPEFELDPDGTITDMGSHPYILPVTISMIPWDEWVIVRPGGGHFGFDATIQNNSEDLFQGVVWTELITPDQNNFGPIGIYPLQLEAGQVLEASPQQFVPWWAPSGIYTYIANVGHDVDTPLDSDSFEFWKVGLEADGASLNDWLAIGWETETDELIIESNEFVPSDFGIQSVYPNPFNPSTEITVGLTGSSFLQLNVFDINGRLVSTIASSHFEQGYHSFTLDASGLASGVYFVHATAPGLFDDMRKVVLLK